ncbi:hypothetical protein HB767_03345 [Listeria welshimeri]|nr:hypothetical protein [Listeria welshimeri]MBC1698195.1 hypothetical protein [Listeria welshimeri]
MNDSEPRTEIENIIKKLNIDRNSFFEISKNNCKKIENKIISKFIYKKDGFDFNLNRGYLRYNPKLRCIGINYLITNVWWEWFKLLPNMIERTEAFYIVFTGESYTWIYSGFLDELMLILYHGSPIGGGDCYIVSKKFDWLIGYSDDGDFVTCVDDSSYFSIDKIAILDKNIKVVIL